MNIPFLKIGLFTFLFLLFGSGLFSSIGLTQSPWINSNTNHLFSSAQSDTNITESGCCTVNGYDSQNSFSYSNQSTPDSYGNYAFATVTAFALNPLSNNDPNYDYYIFDIYASVTSASYAGWWVNSAGLTDKGGPSLTVYAESYLSVNQSIYLPYYSPSTYTPDNSGSTPQTTSLSFGYDGFSFGYSHTFTSPLSQTEPTNEQSSYVSWNSAANTNGNPTIASYQYDFGVGMKVPKGQPATIGILIEGNFYQSYSCGFLGLSTCYNYDTVFLSFPVTFHTPPVTTITSSPAGSGYVDINGTPVTTPAKFVWDEGNTHTITASPYVNIGSGVRYSFASWSDGGAISQNFVAPIVPTNLTANFQQQDELNISSSAGGTTDPPPNSYWYNNTQVAVVTAHPQTGYILQNWVLDGVDKGNASQISILMTKPHSLTELYLSVPTITVTADNGGTVIVQSNAIDNGVPQLIPSGGDVTYGVPTGSNVTITEKMNAGYSFVQWTGSQSSQLSKFSVIVQGNMQESAVFSQNQSTTTSTSSSTTMTTTTTTTSTSTTVSTSITQQFPPTSTSTSPPSISPTILLASAIIAVVAIGAVVASLFIRRRI